MVSLVHDETLCITITLRRRHKKPAGLDKGTIGFLPFIQVSMVSDGINRLIIGIIRLVNGRISGLVAPLATRRP